MTPGGMYFMLFTKECDYAIRIMRALSDGELVSVSNICAAEQLPSTVTYKITKKTGKTGSFKKLPRHKWRILSEPDII